MEIQYCPVVRPTLEEFNNFYQFVENLDKTYKDEWGMVKVILILHFSHEKSSIPLSSTYSGCPSTLMETQDIKLQRSFGKSDS